MLNFNCRVIDSMGNIIVKNYVAADALTLKKLVSCDNNTILSYKKNRSTKLLKINKNSVLLFTQTISLLLESNLSLKDSIKISSTSLRDTSLIILTELIYKGLLKGESFSNILKKKSIGFSSLYLGLIEVGEKTGTLKIVIRQLSIYLERDKKFRDKIIGATIYPIFIVVISTLFSLLFITVILPQFTSMFSSLGGEVNTMLKDRGNYISIIFFSSLGLSTLLFLLSLIIKGSNYESIYLKIPIIGKIILEQETLNFIFALSVLTESSLTIEESIKQGKEVIGNRYLNLEAEKIRNRVLLGDKLSTAFSISPFPQKIESFIKVGEETGNLSEILNRLTTYYTKEGDRKMDRFMEMIDPLFTLLIGASLFVLILLFIIPILTTMGEII